jgi:ferredoxin-nitrate reductase
VPDEFNSEKPDSDFPFILTTGRIRDQWHTMSKTGKVNKLNQHFKQAFVEIPCWMPKRYAWLREM